jgi:hypothetical protein
MNLLPGWVFHQIWKLIEKEVTGDLTPVLTRQNVRVVFGVAICQSKLSSINGIPVKNVIGLSLFVMALNLACYTGLVGLDPYRAEKEWYGKRKTGSLSKILPTAQWMNKDRDLYDYCYISIIILDLY